MYKYQVNFDKVFVAGIFKGKRYTNAYLRFCTWKEAENFRVLCDGKTVIHACAGEGDYIREDATLTAIEPETVRGTDPDCRDYPVPFVDIAYETQDGAQTLRFSRVIRCF